MEDVLNMDTKVKNEKSNYNFFLSPDVNIYENSDDYTLIALMPGVQKDSINLKFDNNYLTVSGEAENKFKENKVVLKEAYLGKYKRVFKLSDSIDAEKISASYDNGILTVTMPKHDRVKAKTINVK